MAPYSGYLVLLYICGTKLLTKNQSPQSPQRQSAQMSKITNDGLTLSVIRRFIALLIWQQWASKG